MSLKTKHTPEAIVARRDGFNEAARVCKCIVADMRERHVAHTKRVILAKHGEGIADLMCTACELATAAGGRYNTYPSTPRREAIFPDRIADLTSAAVPANWNVYISDWQCEINELWHIN